MPEGVERSVWTVKGGRRGEREERFLTHNVIGGGWEELPDLSTLGSREELAELYERVNPEQSAKTRSTHVGQLWSLVHRMQVGDIVVVTLKTTGAAAVGKITSGYEHRDDLGADLPHIRRVEWLRTDVPRDAFDQDLLYSFGAFLTFGRVKRDRAAGRVLAVVHGQAPPPRDLTSQDEVAAEEAPDVEAVAREQIRQRIAERFAGHSLSDLVDEVLKARGFSYTHASDPGPDGGVDILAGSGPMGLEAPHLVVQVKTGQADIDTYRALRGLVEHYRASEGLLVAWRGFRGTVRAEARNAFFTMRLWDADDLLDEIFEVYDQLPYDIRSELPLKRVWSLVSQAGTS